MAEVIRAARNLHSGKGAGVEEIRLEILNALAVGFVGNKLLHCCVEIWDNAFGLVN